MQKTVNVSNDVKELDIHISYGELYIEDGETFTVELEWIGENEIFAAEENGCLRIWNERKDKRIPISKKYSDIIRVCMTIPSEKTFEKVRIVSGAGEFQADRLCADSVIVQVGAGELQIRNMKVSSFAHVESGAGAVSIEDGEIHNLNMDLGAGGVEINAALIGNANINAGVGELLLNLHGNADDYSVTVNRGFGNCSINGYDCRNGNTYGDGENRIKVSGGIGSIAVSFEQM